MSEFKGVGLTGVGLTRVDCSTNYFYSYSNTSLPTLSNFEFLSSEQIAIDIIHFLVQASPHQLPNNLQLVVFENMLIKHYKQSHFSHRFIVTRLSKS